MASIVGLDDLSAALIEAGNRLVTPPSSTEELLTLLNETESLLRDVGQDQTFSMQTALIPSKNALVSSDLLTHPDSDVRVSLVSCLTEIVRITSPEPPYSDDLMKDIFRLTVEAFEKLADASSRSYEKAESVLDTVSKLSSCLIMLDLECNDLILQMFRIFLRSDHSWVVSSSMEMIMVTVIDETDEVSKDLLDTLLTSVKKENKNVSPMSWSLAEKVLSRCARTLQPYIKKALKSTGTSLDLYSPVVSSICQTVFETPKVNNEAAETKLAPRDSLEDKLGSKGPAREGTLRINVNDKVRKGNSLKQVQCEGTDAETNLGTTGKRGRKPNSLMNPEEGYDISWLSGKRDPLKTCSNKKLRGSSLGKVTGGSVKRSRVHDLGSLSSPRFKKLSSCFRDEEAKQERCEVSEEDDRKIENSSKKKTVSKNVAEKSQRTAKQKPMVVNSSGKRSSKDKESDMKVFGADLVGKRVNIWWPLDKTFYEGVVQCYCGRRKMHLVLYTDGEREELNLIKERWELLEDRTSGSEDMETDMPESVPLLDIMQRQKVKKSENTSSSAIRSSRRTAVKKDSGRGGSKAGVVKNLKSFNAETDRKGEQEVSEDEDSQSEDEYYNTEKREPSGNKSAECLKLADREAEAKEEEKEGADSEAESEREGSESDEEPKWRETEDTEDEAEEVDDKSEKHKLG